MEAVVILIVPLIALFVAGTAILLPQPVDVAAERARIDQHIAWLEERLVHARAGNWDEQMLENLHAQLAAAHRQRARLQAA